MNLRNRSKAAAARIDKGEIMGDKINGIDEMTIITIITSAGEASALIQQSLEAVEKGDYVKADEYWAQADEALSKAHAAHSEILHSEALGEGSNGGSLLVHAQDHLMNAILFKQVMRNMIHMQKEINELRKG